MSGVNVNKNGDALTSLRDNKQSSW